MVARAGHSLVELIVAMMVLGVALSGVAATSALSLGLAREAYRLEEDVARAVSILDSLAAHDAPGSAALVAGRTVYQWTVTPSSDGWFQLAVAATDSSTASTIVELTGATAPPPPRALVP